MPQMRRGVIVLAVFESIALACAEPRAPLAEGPPASPQPPGAALFGDWHVAALGAPPDGVEASRGDIAKCYIGVPPGRAELDLKLRRGWAQVDTVWGPSRRDGSRIGQVCILHPPPGSVPHLLRSVRPLPSGALEGTLVEVSGAWLVDESVAPDGATFLLASGVVVVARGTALAPTRALLARSAAPPAPLPMAPEVAFFFWTHDPRPRLVWHLDDARRTRVERQTYSSPAAAESEAASMRTSMATIERHLPESKHTVIWWHGSDVFQMTR